MKMVRFCLMALGISVMLAGNAWACSLRMPARAASQYVPAGNLNISLLDAAVRAEVNLARCSAGLRPLGGAGNSLAKMASAHSRWMISARSLSHRSNVRGRATQQDRLRAAGVRARRGSENLGYVSRYQIDGGRFRVIDAARCSFASNSGQTLPPHTYASLARQIVREWMNSSGHRRNILDPNVARVSTGAAFDRSAPYCGRIWFTQNFVG